MEIVINEIMQIFEINSMAYFNALLLIVAVVCIIIIAKK